MKISCIKTVQIVVIATALATSFYAFASAQQRVDLSEKMKRACFDKDEGDICDFTNNTGESINGQCKRSGSADGKLTCVPTN